MSVNDQAAIITAQAKRITALERAAGNSITKERVDALEAEVDALQVPSGVGPWIDLVVNDEYGYYSNRGGGYQPLQGRVEGSRLRLRGHLTRAAGFSPDLPYKIANIPEVLRPYRQLEFWGPGPFYQDGASPNVPWPISFRIQPSGTLTIDEDSYGNDMYNPVGSPDPATTTIGVNVLLPRTNEYLARRDTTTAITDASGSNYFYNQDVLNLGEFGYNVSDGVTTAYGVLTGVGTTKDAIMLGNASNPMLHAANMPTGPTTGTRDLLFPCTSGTVANRLDVAQSGSNMGLNVRGGVSWPNQSFINTKTLICSSWVQDGANKPASTPAWTAPTLVNGWTNYGYTWQTAGYLKLRDDTVWVKGLIQGGTSAAQLGVYNTAFTLPEGYRPPADMLVSVACYHTSNNHTHGAVLIKSNGEVRPFALTVDTSNLWWGINFSFSTLP